MLVLPDDLYQAIARALMAAPAVRWIRAAQALSERYRAPREAHDQPLAAGADQALGYVALIFPAAYAQLRGAMAATAARAPGWEPRTLLDLGSGPGTALWAATAQWPSLRSLTAWEREPAFIALGRQLARDSSAEAIRSTHWERVDLRSWPDAAEREDRETRRETRRRETGDRRQETWRQETRDKRQETRRQEIRDNGQRMYDLVVLGHMLNELAPDDRRRVIARAWQMTAGLLLIVEPGTSAAFGVVRGARDELLAAGAYTIAPCAHDRPCPLQDDWCHFPQRLKRPDFQRRARAAPSEWEDSKFSYAAMARFAPAAPIWGRVIREPSSNKAYAEVTISMQAGVARYRGLKRHREAFRLVKELEWGQALDQPPPEPIARLESDK